jgi:hypothetical protein
MALGMNPGSIGDGVLDQPVSRQCGRGLVAALRTLMKTIGWRDPGVENGEPNLRLYFCPFDPAALPFGWRAVEERGEAVSRPPSGPGARGN